MNLKHVPHEREAAFVDRHHRHSINALCVADTDLIFRFTLMVVFFYHLDIDLYAQNFLGALVMHVFYARAASHSFLILISNHLSMQNLSETLHFHVYRG